MEIFSIARSCPLFVGFTEAEFGALLQCLAASRRRYERGGFIFSAGERPGAMGVVLAGRVHILKEDAWGNQNLLADIGGGDLFAEAIACAGIDAFPVSAVAAEDSDILLLDYQRVVHPCGSACALHSRIIENMLRILARKNLLLVDKIEHITQRTTRGKLLSYLSEQSRKCGSRAFDIPFNRQQMADYLSVERSALSAELGKMRQDGLIAFRKNHFELLPKAIEAPNGGHR